MDEAIKIALHGSLAELMVKILTHIYRQHVIYEKLSPILYVILKKALYVCLRLPLLFNEWIVVDMRHKGFDINPCNPCVANKMVGGKKMVVYWHVENLKVSHLYPKEV